MVSCASSSAGDVGDGENGFDSSRSSCDAETENSVDSLDGLGDAYVIGRGASAAEMPNWWQ